MSNLFVSLKKSKQNYTNVLEADIKSLMLFQQQYLSDKEFSIYVYA